MTPPTRTDSIDSTPANLDETNISQTFNIYRPAFHRHYEIKSVDEQPLYYVNISSFKPNKPELTLHASPSSASPIIAASKFLKFSTDCKLALGDPDDLTNTQWEDMTLESSIHPRYHFEMTIPDGNGSGHGERRIFVWKRTHSVKVENTRAFPLSLRSFKMIEERTGQVVAVFSRERSITKCGKLQIRVEYGEEFARMVLISWLSLFEKGGGGS